MKDSKLLFNKWDIKKVILGFVIIILILSGWTWGYFVHDRDNKTILDLNNRIVELDDDNTKLNEDLIDLEKKYEDVKQTNDELTNSKDETEKELEDKKSDYYTVLNELSTYKSHLYCLNYKKFDSNYTNTTSAATNLEEYVKSISGGRVYRNNRYTIWNDSRTARHEILIATDRGEIVGYKFIVYYDEEGFSDKAVYNINGQCWLYNKAFE